jgi:hypothetical protein
MQDSARLANLSGYVEMNLSQVGKDDKRTRVGYKDQVSCSNTLQVLAFVLMIAYLLSRCH